MDYNYNVSSGCSFVFAAIPIADSPLREYLSNLVICWPFPLGICVSSQVMKDMICMIWRFPQNGEYEA
jgi:hypothetical protein